VLVYHTTPSFRAQSILTHGLRPSGKSKVIWLHDATLFEWVLRHLAQWHQCNPQSLVTFPVRCKYLRTVGGRPSGRYIACVPAGTLRVGQQFSTQHYRLYYDSPQWPDTERPNDV